MPPTSRCLLLAGSVLLVALGPVAVPDESTVPAGAAVVAVGSEAPAGVPVTGGLLQRVLDASRGAAPPRRRPRPHRELRGGSGPCRSGLVVLTFDDGPDPAARGAGPTASSAAVA